MITAADLPPTLSVFPLPKALLLPRARLPLHIFEPRYLAMLDDVLKTPERLIGMVQPASERHGTDGLNAIGCAGRVTAFSETEDGRYMITLTGVSRFRITKEVEGFTPYRKCDVSWSGFERDLGASEDDDQLDRDGFMTTLVRYFDTVGLQVDWETLRDADDEMLINYLSILCPFDVEDKQALLEAPCLKTRRETLVMLFEYELRRGSEEETLQ